MGRLKVTPKGKVKKNIPITRIGKKQYLKRRFAHVRAVDVAGANNKLTQKYVAGQHLTATQGFSHLGLRMDASGDTAKLTQEHLKLPETRRKVNVFQKEEEDIKAQEAYKKAAYIGRPVSEQEGSMIASLLQTYGVDIKRMTYDHRLNPFQLNARQLQRQIVNYLKWEKAAFPKQFAEAEKKGWFSVETYADPKLRLGISTSREEMEKIERVQENKEQCPSPSSNIGASSHHAIECDEKIGMSMPTLSGKKGMKNGTTVKSDSHVSSLTDALSSSPTLSRDAVCHNPAPSASSKTTAKASLSHKKSFAKQVNRGCKSPKVGNRK